MNTRRFKILCNGSFIGFIFISDSNPKFPKSKVATIAPFEKQGSWNEDDLELVGQRTITNIYDIITTDKDIQHDLLQRANVNPADCVNFQILEYSLNVNL